MYKFYIMGIHCIDLVRAIPKWMLPPWIKFHKHKVRFIDENSLQGSSLSIHLCMYCNVQKKQNGLPTFNQLQLEVSSQAVYAKPYHLWKQTAHMTYM